MNAQTSKWLPGSSFLCGCGRTHTVATSHIEMGQGAFDHLEGFLESALLKDGVVLAVYDGNTYAVAGARLRAALGKKTFKEFIFKTSGGDLPADMRSLSELDAELKSVRPALVLAVGSGVISDLVKVAANELQIPYISIPTAPSMDGYLSANAALLAGGMKRQFNGLRPPLALFSETEIVMSAPDKMIRAGLGDALGKFTSLAEWRINNIVRDEYCCNEAVSMLEGEILSLLSAAETEELRSKTLVECLMRVLLHTGALMQATGSSAAASCGEHYISHAMEMRGYALHGHAPSFHGLQVAWGASVVISAYEAMRGGLLSGFSLDLESMRKVYLSHIQDWKSVGVDVSKSIEDKVVLLESLGPRLDLISGDACAEPVSWLLGHAGRVESAFKRHSMPLKASEIGLSREDALFALRHAVDIRQRITIFDLLQAHGSMSAFEKLLAGSGAL